jgi:hypothetical protein
MKSVLFIFVCACFLTCSGQEISTGSRSQGIAGASVCLSDVWSVNNNQAGLALLSQAEAAFYYQNPYLLNAFQHLGFALALPFKTGAFGLAISDFGYSLYQQTSAGLAYAIKLGNYFSCGVRLDYLNTTIAEGYGTSGTLAGEAGIMARISPALSIGAQLYNPTRSRLATYNGEQIPTSFRLGVLYLVSPLVHLCLETEKNTLQNANLKTGLEYLPNKLITIRCGVATSPATCSFGSSLRYQQVCFDISSSWQPTTGFIPSVGVNYFFQKITSNK